MNVSRKAYLKKDAKRIKKWMHDAGFATVVITGERGDWLVSTAGSVLSLAKFASVEAKYESRK